MKVNNLKMKCKIIFTILFIFVILLYGCNNTQHINELVSNGDKEYYYGSDGQKVKNSFYAINGKVYYFDKSGIKVKNSFADYNGNKYYLDMIGNVSKGWKEINNDWYFFDKEDGKLMKGWQNDNGKWYYLGKDGIMQKSKWVDNEYYLKNDGTMCMNEWYAINGDKCYFNTEGKYDRNMRCQIIFDNIPKNGNYLYSWRSSVRGYVDVYGNVTNAYIREGIIKVEGTITANGPREVTGFVQPRIYYEVYDSRGYKVYDGSIYIGDCRVGDKFSTIACNLGHFDKGETYHFKVTAMINSNY